MHLGKPLIALAAAAALAASLVVGAITRRLLVRIEGDRFHASAIAATKGSAVSLHTA